MNNVIECNNLTHFYGKRCIYSNLNFKVPEGRIMGLLGKNGTGKTTTINIINGFFVPNSGECRVFGELAGNLSPKTKQRVGILIEGHVQYSFMNVEQIDKFYSAFYPRWNREPYYELMAKLKIAPRQLIRSMSCGQKSQVALGLLLAQDAELLILDDFSMGLDPGYRKLFIDYLRAYVKAENKTVFATSHIIQDMEQLADDCLILDYGRILYQGAVNNVVSEFKKYRFRVLNGHITTEIEGFCNVGQIKSQYEMFSFLNEQEVQQKLIENGILFDGFKVVSLSLEDAFIGLTGKY